MPFALRTAVILSLAAAMVVAVAELADERVGARHVDAFDSAVTHAIRRLDSPLGDAVMGVASRLGSWPMLALVSVAAALAVRRRGWRRMAGVIAAVAVTAVALTGLLKELFQRSRPSLFLQVPSPGGFSFPSGHALMSAAVYGVLAVAAVRLRPRARAPIVLGTSLLVGTVGFSRVYLGVHWPTDVVGGFAAGVILVVAGGFALRRARPIRRPPSTA